MKILVISRGNGYGHAKRDWLAARALERLGHEVSIASYAAGLEFLRLIYDGHLIDLQLPAAGSSAERILRLHRVLLEQRPELLVVDEELGALPIAKNMGIPTCLITNWLEDEKETLGFLEMADQIVVVDEESHWLFPMPASIRERVRFVGPILDVPAARSAVEPKITVTSGAPTVADIRFFVHALTALKEHDAYRVQAYGGTLTRSLRRSCDPSVVFMDDRGGFLAEAAASSLVICRGGHTTLWELAALGVPVIAIPRPEDVNPYNILYAKQMHARGYAHWLDESTLTPEGLSAMVAEVLGRPVARYVPEGDALERMMAGLRELSRLDEVGA